MRGRTYRYAVKEPLYPFGFGLSYTRFRYSALAVSSSRLRAGESVDVCVTVENVGPRSGDEVVQLYVHDRDTSCPAPRRELRGFERITLAAGESLRLELRLSARDLSLIDSRGRRVVEPGRFLITVGGSQPDARSVALTESRPLSVEIDVEGPALELPY
jgi:beta-glucosidase